MTSPHAVRSWAAVKKTKQKPQTRPWTSADVQTLRENGHLGVTTVSLLLGRSSSAVRMQAHAFRISLRRQGERRGLVIGQPRGQAILPRIRGDIVDGRVSDEAIAARMQLIQESTLCPVCCARPIEVPTTGWCLHCHRASLVAAHLQELEKLDSQRALWASRQALCRGRRAAGEEA